MTSVVRGAQKAQAMAEPEPWRHTLKTLHPASPITFRNILFPTDFSFTASRALPYAVEVARRSQATIHAVHVISPRASPTASPEEWSQVVQDDQEFRERGKIEIEHALQELPHDLLFPKGDVWENLEEVIADKEVDLIVMATHGRTGIAKALMGSVAEKIFRQAPCPVLTVGPGVSSRASHAAAAELNCIVYATDFSPESLAASRYAISLARDHHAQLILLHVVKEGTTDGEGVSLETLQCVVPLGANLSFNPQFIVERGRPADAILRIAEKAHADLIVLGARQVESHITAAVHFSDSTAHQVLASAHCPVLTVHN
ncbi:MAG TPA: universal stress protein [Candidatus Acidoferrales bacterium]|nr:universal stress protein [Candidatus Acidoferrales bacterium]